MSKLFEEALADAKKLKEIAEENAKKAILESVTPKIKEFIENQILEQEEEEEEEEEKPSEEQKESIESLLEMLGAKDIIKNIQNKNALSNYHIDTLNRLSESDQSKIKKLIKKINKQKNNLEQNNIINSVNTIQENNLMRNREKFYEVDLSLLREAVDDAAMEIASKEIDNEEEGLEEEGFLDQMQEMDHEHGHVNEYSYLFEEDEEESEEESEEEPEAGLDMDIGAAPGGELDDGVNLPMDLARELQSILDAEIEGGAADAGGAEDLAPLDIGEEESSEEESEDLNEIFDIDPRMLKQEIANVRRMMNEGNVDHHFGGKGSGNIGHKNAYGGTGPKKAGYQKSFGGGSYGKDVFVTPPSTLKKLNEAIQQLRKLSRMNRAQNEKLNKYRGAVQTLREQLEDLNLFNAKLLYVNKLLQNKSLNESQKKSVIKALDEAKSLGETKALFISLTESLSSSKSSLNESTRFGSSSRATTSGSDTQSKVVGESDRWAKLAGLK